MCVFPFRDEIICAPSPSASHPQSRLQDHRATEKGDDTSTELMFAVNARHLRASIRFRSRMNAKRRTKSSGIHPPRLLLVTDLSHGIGRRLLTSVDEQIRTHLPDWHLSVRDLRDVDLKATATPKELGVEATVINDGSATITLYRSGQPDTDFSIDQRLAGSLLADVLLRRGFRHFHRNKENTGQTPDDSQFALGFHDELRNADLSPDHHFHTATNPAATGHQPTIAAAIDPESAAAIVATLNAFSSHVDSPPILSAGPSDRWLATILVEQLTLEPITAKNTAISPHLIPPVLADSPTDIASLPTHFTDALIAEVSACIDEQLLRSHAPDVAELSAKFATPRRTLERRFRDRLGTSVHREITRRQVAMARNHLLLPDVTPSGAAALVGYPTTRMLSINFRKLHKISPRAFQRQHLTAKM